MKKKITRNGMFKKWIKALRSGKYEQGRHQLKTKATTSFGPTHCCLGVLCEVAKEEGLISSFRGDNGEIPEKLANFMGIDSMGKFNKARRGHWSLASMNDNNGYENFQGSFKYIANLLEKSRKLVLVEED